MRVQYFVNKFLWLVALFDANSGGISYIISVCFQSRQDTLSSSRFLISIKCYVLSFKLS